LVVLAILDTRQVEDALRYLRNKVVELANLSVDDPFSTFVQLGHSTRLHKTLVTFHTTRAHEGVFEVLRVVRLFLGHLARDDFVTVAHRLDCDEI